MKYKKIIISAVVKMFFITLFITNSVASEVNASSNVYLNKTKATLIKGESVKLKIKGTKKAVKWKSKNKKIATVSKKGMVVAKKQGTAKIVATVSGKKYICIIKVKNLSKEMKTVSLNIGSSRKLKVLNYNKKLKWSSKNKKVATVSANGKVTGISLGVTTIIAESEDTRIKWRVKVKGVDEEVDDIDNTVVEGSK